MTIAAGKDLKDDEEYLYHYAKVGNYNDWKDDLFRGKLWNPSNSFPHKLLKNKQLTLKDTEAQFIICFYSSYGNAIKFQPRDFMYSKTQFLRVSKQDLITSGFTQSWDDGFNNGEVYLFWIIDKSSINSSDRSDKGLTIDKVQVQYNDAWISVREHRKIAITGLTSATEITTNKPLSLWGKGLKILFG